MNSLKKLSLVAISFVLAMASADGAERSIKINRQYLNFPVSHSLERKAMTFTVDGRKESRSVIRLAEGAADYWTFRDVSQLRGKTIKITYEGSQKALDNIVLADSIMGGSMIYHESSRPQYHFTTRRGWINDPNGLIFYRGKYHMFYQHNPYERDWENMHWGHTVSTDLIHWDEQPLALHPDEIGTMFSGTAVIDYSNTSGFGRGKDNPAFVVFYTADSPSAQRQCMAYSLDEGRTFTKYEGNPIIDSHEKWQSHDTRDPKVLWYAPGKHWSMVLNERDGHSIYTSSNLKDWTYQSHLTGLWECPELFELPVEGNPSERKWVMWGASGTYMVGDFDGKVFTPITPKQQNLIGSAYAAQTFSNIPQSDGRVIKMAWSRLGFGDAPFNGLMLLPQEQVLVRTHFGGWQLLSRPARETESIFTLAEQGENLTADQANALLSRHNSDLLRIRFTIELTYAIDAGLSYNGQRLVDYDMNSNRLNGQFYAPDVPGSMLLTVDVYVDRSVVEVYADGGRMSDSFSLKSPAANTDGYRIFGKDVKVKKLEVYNASSIWK